MNIIIIITIVVLVGNIHMLFMTRDALEVGVRLSCNEAVGITSTM